MAEKSKAKGDKPLYLVFGEDEYLVAGKARELVDKLCPPADQGFGLETIEARVDTVADAVTAISRCIEALQTLGFLGGRKVVWLRDVSFFERTQVAESETFKGRVEDLVKLIKAGLSPGQILVISALKVDKRSAFFKACQAAGEVIEFALPEKSYQLERQARERAMATFREAGLSIRSDALEEFLERTGTDTRQIVQEVEKVALYVGDRKDVTAKDVRAIVSSSREAIAWDLADAVGSRDLIAALKTLRQLLFQGENPMSIMYGLESRVRDLMLFREGMDRRWLRVSGEEPWLKAEWTKSPEVDAVMETFAKDPRAVNPFRAGKLVAQAKNFSLKQLHQWQDLIVETHEAFVSASTPKELLLEFLLIKLMGGKRAAVRT